MTRQNWNRPVHRLRGKQTEHHKSEPPITAPLARRQGRARAALAEATARTSDPAPVAIAECPHNRAGESLRVYLSFFRGRAYVHARRFHLDDDGETQPGKGLGVHVGNLPALTRAFGEALTRARELGFLPEEAE